MTLVVCGALLLGAWSLAGELGIFGSEGPLAWIRELAARALALPRRDPVGAAVLLYLASAAASTVASPNPGQSLFGAPESTAGLRTAAATAAIYFAARSLPGTPETLDRLAAATAFGAAAAAGYALLQMAGLDPLEWGRTAVYGQTLRVFGTLGHPNFLGAYLAMALPLIAWGAARARSGVVRIIWLAIGAMSLAALAATLSRAAWAGFVVAGVAGALLWRVSRRGAGARAREPMATRRRPYAIAALTVALGLGVGALAMRSPLGPALAARAHDLVNPQATTTQTRLHIWAAGLRMAAGHPILGAGLDAFGTAFPAQRTAAYWRLEWGATPAKAHNEAIQILATQGIFGALAALLVVLLVARAAGRAFRATASRRAAVVAVMALIAFGIQDLASFTVVSIGILASAICGWLAAAGGGRSSEAAAATGAGRPPPRPAWALVVAFGCAMLAMGPLVARPWQAQLAERLASIVPGGSPERIAALSRAAAAAPWDARYLAGIAFARYQRAQGERDPELRRHLLAEALGNARRAVGIEPENGIYRATEGQIQAEQTFLAPPAVTIQEAAATLRGALARDTANAEIGDLIGYALVRIGRPAEGRAIYLRLAALYPDLAQPMGLIGLMALDEGRVADGLDTLRLALARDWKGQTPPHASTWSNYAVGCLSAGRFREARDAAAEALRLDPSLQAARDNLALAEGALRASGGDSTPPRDPTRGRSGNQ